MISVQYKVPLWARQSLRASGWDVWVAGQRLRATELSDLDFSGLSFGPHLTVSWPGPHLSGAASRPGPVLGRWEQRGTIRQPGLRLALKRRGIFLSITSSLSAPR